MHDRFVVSGNQLNSLNLGVSVPLPLFDRGTFREQAARAARALLADERTRKLEVARARLPSLARRLDLSRRRCTQLDRELLPRAREVLGSLERAVENRLLPLTQVIQARRIVSELLIEQAESCGDAYGAALELLREQPTRGDVP